jgi:outer membrane protein TolC
MPDCIEVQKGNGIRMLNNRFRILTACLVLLITGKQGIAQTGTGPASLSMDEFVQQVIDRNPAIAADQAVIEASISKIPQVGTLPDPMVSFSLMNIPVTTFKLNQEPMTMKQFTITQGFPARGVLDARTAVAEAGVLVASGQLHLTSEQLRQQAKNSFLNLFFLDESISIVTENQALLQQFIQNAETRYTTGRGIQQDVLKAQLEHSRLTEKMIILEDRRIGLVSQLNAMRDMSVDTPIKMLTLPTGIAELLTAEELSETANEKNPTMVKARAIVEQRRTSILLAERLRRPSWSVSTAYGQRDGGRRDFISGMVGVVVPIRAGRKQDKAVEEAHARLTEAHYRLRSAELQIESTIESLAGELNRSRRLMELYAGQILPQAEGVLTSALEGYRVDQIDFLTLLAAQTTLFNYQLEAIRVTTDYHRQLADLEAVTGTSLDELTRQ